MQAAKKKIAPYLFISPFFIVYAVIGIYPMLYGFWISFQKQLKTSSGWEFIGLRNYERVLGDDLFWKSLYNVIYYTCGSLFVILPVALLIAHLLNNRFLSKVKGPLTTILFTPNVTSVLVVSIVFSYILRTEGGVINSILGIFGVPQISFLLDPKWGVPSIILLGLWRYVGINSIYFLVGLKDIPEEIRESATLDGANSFQQLIFVTLPLLRPIMTFIVFQAIIGSFNIFGEPFLLAGRNGGTQSCMLFPTMYLYTKGFGEFNFGFAAAMGYLLTVLMFGITMIQLKIFSDK